MEYRNTRHQVARGSRPDAEAQGKIYLLKHVAELRLTYQVRLLTYLAEQREIRLVIRIASHSRVSRDMSAFAKEHKAVLRIERGA